MKAPTSDLVPVTEGRAKCLGSPGAGRKVQSPQVDGEVLQPTVQLMLPVVSLLLLMKGNFVSFVCRNKGAEAEWFKTTLIYYLQ